MRIILMPLTALLLMTPSAMAQETLTERSGFLIDHDRSRNVIVLGANRVDLTGLSLATNEKTAVFKESPAGLPDIFRGTSLSVVGTVNGNRIEVKRLTALAVSPEEGRYKNKVVGRLEKQDGKRSLLVNEGIYQLSLNKQTVVLRHEKADLNRLQTGQKLTVTVEETKEKPPLARQIIFEPSDDEKLEKDRILL